jgi:YVTN family beta-propeller protein
MRTGITRALCAVGREPADIAITPNGKTAYVVNGYHRVTPIRTATNTAGKAIRIGTPITTPEGSGLIAITPDGKTVYVANFFSNTVTRIRTATDRRIKHVKVGTGPDYIAFVP